MAENEVLTGDSDRPLRIRSVPSGPLLGRYPATRRDAAAWPSFRAKTAGRSSGGEGEILIRTVHAFLYFPALTLEELETIGTCPDSGSTNRHNSPQGATPNTARF
jgi:hypothetical protein